MKYNPTSSTAKPWHVSSVSSHKECDQDIIVAGGGLYKATTSLLARHVGAGCRLVLSLEEDYVNMCICDL